MVQQASAAEPGDAVQKKLARDRVRQRNMRGVCRRFMFRASSTTSITS